jgi:hypothetical protein
MEIPSFLCWLTATDNDVGYGTVAVAASSPSSSSSSSSPSSSSAPENQPTEREQNGKINVYEYVRLAEFIKQSREIIMFLCVCKFNNMSLFVCSYFTSFCTCLLVQNIDMILEGMKSLKQ